MLLLFACIGWLAGLWAGPWLQVDPLWLSVSAVSALTLGLLWRRSPPLLLAAVCVAAMLLGAVRYQSGPASAGPPAMAAHHGRPVDLEGWVAADPEVRDQTSHLRIEALAIHGDSGREPINGTVLVIAARYPQHNYGEVVRLRGKLDAPRELEGFDYPGYLARQGIHSTMMFPRVEPTGERAGFPVLAWLMSARTWMAGNLSMVLAEPQSSLAQGFLLGIKSSIPQDIMEAFSRTGTAHIIVISGQNLTLLAGYALRAGQPVFGRRRALWLALILITSYTFLVGAQPPVLRANIMSGIFILGAYLGRQREAATALGAAAAIMSALDPLLLWDVSFQLSFAATAGLLFIAPRVLEVLERAPGAPLISLANSAGRARSYVLESLAVTAAATIAVSPLLMINFERLPVLGVASNLLLLPALPGIMLTGAVAAVLGFVPVAGQAAGWLAWPFLTYLSSGVSFLSSLPLPSIEMASLDVGAAVAYYALVCVALLWMPFRPRTTT